MGDLHHVVIIGGGFGGLQAALALRSAPVRLTLVDRRNFHLFQPLLYQVATGTLAAANIASPLRTLLQRQANARVLLGEAVGLDAVTRTVQLNDGTLTYDTLVVAAGARYHYFGHPEWERHAPGLKTVEDATHMRQRIFTAFEAAEWETDPARRAEWLTFVIVGAGPTGVELAGALAEIARHTLRREFRTIDTTSARILLVDVSTRVLTGFSPGQAATAEAALVRLGITIRYGCQVMDIGPRHVVLHHGVSDERIATRTVLWAAGVQGAPIGAVITDATGAALDRGGRIVVGPDCAITTHPEILVIGDLARVGDPDAPPLPGVAPVAIQQGRYVAGLIIDRLHGRTRPPFAYRDRGSMATIGRSMAIVTIGRWEWSGFLAWLAWLFVHLMALVRFENRLLVLAQWSWHYLTWNSNARLLSNEATSTDRETPPV